VRVAVSKEVVAVEEGPEAGVLVVHARLGSNPAKSVGQAPYMTWNWSPRWARCTSQARIPRRCHAQNTATAAPSSALACSLLATEED
jgi:hypothetical protein